MKGVSTPSINQEFLIWQNCPSKVKWRHSQTNKSRRSLDKTQGTTYRQCLYQVPAQWRGRVGSGCPRNCCLNRPAVHATRSPVAGFQDSCCWPREMGKPIPGGFCNFVYLQPIFQNLCGQLYGRGCRARYLRTSLPRPLIGQAPQTPRGNWCPAPAAVFQASCNLTVALRPIWDQHLSRNQNQQKNPF